MPVRTSTDHDEIAAVLDPIIAADPVAGTILGTIRLGLTATAWAAWTSDAAGTPTGPVAARSGVEWPIALSGDWSGTDLDDLLELLRAQDGVRGLSGTVDLVATAVAALGRPLGTDVAQRLYRCDDLVPPTVSGSWLFAGDHHRPLLRGWFQDFADEAHEVGRDTTAIADAALDSGLVLLWVDSDGTPVSMAARRPVVAGSARVGPVFTPHPLRGHGYASGVTAAATRGILDEGAVPVLFTDLANPVSNRIYQALGYRAVEDRRVVIFAV